MEVTLSRPLVIHCFEVFAEVAKAERRQEIQAVLLLAQGHGDRLTPEQVCEDLLGGRPPIVGRTILRRCREYGLMEGSDEQSFLTEAGRESASKGFVFVPEKGKYRLWVTDDPLFPEAALDLLPVKEEPLSTDHVRESQRTHGWGREKTRGGSAHGALDMKSQAEALRGRVFTPLSSESHPIQINFVGPEWVRVEDAAPPAPARITWKTSETNPGKVRVDGAYRAEGLAPPRVPFLTIWRALLGPYAEDWVNTDHGPVLRCAFEGDGLASANFRSFRRTLEFDSPSIPDLGGFDPLQVDDVPLAPRKWEDAQSWAAWLLQDRIVSYQDERSFGILRQEVLKAFPEFEVELPSAAELLERLAPSGGTGGPGRFPAAFWFLNAPRDLVEVGPSSGNNESEGRKREPPGSRRYHGEPMYEEVRRF